MEQERGKLEINDGSAALARETAGHLFNALKALAHTESRGGCWCGVAHDNPMLRGQHLPQCVEARRVMLEASAVLGLRWGVN